MIVRKGKVEKNYSWSDGTVENAVTENTVATIIEKTEGNYVELLFRKDSYERAEYGTVVACETTEAFTVYHGKTIEQVLALNSMGSGYTWVEELTQVS